MEGEYRESTSSRESAGGDRRRKRESREGAGRVSALRPGENRESRVSRDRVGGEQSAGAGQGSSLGRAERAEGVGADHAGWG